jgi:hypothetical protein
MISDLNGRWFRSRVMPWVTGAALDVDLNFLEPARHMTAPEVSILEFVFEGTVTPSGGTAQGEDFAKLFAQIIFNDESEMINASGAMLRLLEQVELGSKSVDPTDIADGVATAVKYRLKVMLEPLDTRAERPRDFRVPLACFLEGGNLTVRLAPTLPTNFGAAAASWNVIVFAKVHDGRKRELKSRRRIWEQVVQNQEYHYPINGSIRTLLLGSTKTTTGYTDLVSYDTIYSKTLDLPPAMQTHVIVDDYRLGADALGANDEATLPAPGCIPLVIPSRAKKIGQMIDTPLFHLDLLAAAPTSGRLLVDAVVNRSPNMSALAAGYASPEDVATAIAARGRVVGAAGNMKATEVPRPLARKLPIRID